MDKNDASIKKMIVTTVIVGVVMFIAVFAIAFGLFDIDEVKVRDSGVDVKDLTQAELTCSIAQIDTSNEEMKLYDFKNKKLIDEIFTYNSSTKFLNKDSKLMSVKEFKNGDIVEIVYTKKSSILAQVKLSADSWTKKGIIDFNINYAKKKISLNDKDYEMDKEMVMSYNGKNVSYNEFDNNVVISARGYNKIVLALEIEEYLGSVRLIYNSDLDNANCLIDSDKIVKIEEIEDIYLKPGEHIIAITKKGIDEIDLKVMIKEREVTEIEVTDVKVKTAQVRIKSNLTNYYMTVKSSDGGINKTYTDNYADISGAEPFSSSVITLPQGSYVMTFSKDGYKTITRQIVLGTAGKTVNVSFVSISGEVSDATGNDTVKLVIESVPNDASIYINGELKGVGKITMRVPKGNNTVKVEKSGYQTVERNLTLSEDKEYTFTLSAGNVYELPAVKDDIYKTNE